MEILIVAGGSPTTWPVIPFSAFDFVIGVDRGGLFLKEEKQAVQLAIGDFDSLSHDEYLAVQQWADEMIQAPAEKDDTDTQLALVTAWQRYPKANITLIGGTGGRLDHLLSNLWLGIEPRFLPFLRQLRLLDEQNEVTYYGPGAYQVKRDPTMTYLAYCCLTPVKGLELTGSKYTLAKTDVLQPTSYASNEFLASEAGLSFQSGVVAVIQSRDK